MGEFLSTMEYWISGMILFVTFSAAGIMCLVGTLTLTARCMGTMLDRIIRELGVYTLVIQYGLERLRHRQHPLHLNCVTSESGLTAIYLAGRKFAVTTVSPLSMSLGYAGYKVKVTAVNEEWLKQQGGAFPLYYTRIRLDEVC
jgi:hypothetical protein